MSYFYNDDNFTWTDSTITTTGNFTLVGGASSLVFNVGTPQGYPIIPDKDWMPYRHFEYDPLWHKKFAAIKYQMKKMWD